MRADVLLHTLLIADPLSSPSDLARAYAWWEDEVWAWRVASGLVTAEESRLRAENEVEFVQSDGCGQVCVSYRVRVV